jgi:hypothetical protein
MFRILPRAPSRSRLPKHPLGNGSQSREALVFHHPQRARRRAEIHASAGSAGAPGVVRPGRLTPHEACERRLIEALPAPHARADRWGTPRYCSPPTCWRSSIERLNSSSLRMSSD